MLPACQRSARSPSATIKAREACATVDTQGPSFCGVSIVADSTAAARGGIRGGCAAIRLASSENGAQQMFRYVFRVARLTDMMGPI